MRAKSNANKLNGKMMWIIIAILAVFVIGFGIYFIGLGPVDRHDDTEITVDIPTGSGASYIVEILDENGLVKNKFCAKVNAKIGGYNSLQANTYIFKKSMGLREIMRAINKGDFNYVSKQSIQIIDGDRLQEIAEHAAVEMPFSKKDFLAKWSDKSYLKSLIKKYWFISKDILDEDIMYPLEGYLYPDTYFITSDCNTIEAFTEMCLDRMDEELTARKDAIKKSKFSIHELLTLASIVTKESGGQDQSTVAGVFMNRLKEHMSLGSDVTVAYIFQEDRVELKVSQLNSDSPYNTRKVAGLTPGPISAVVGESIDATLNYDKCDYLFFFADKDGKLHFYKTQAEFEKGIDKEGLLEDTRED